MQNKDLKAFIQNISENKEYMDKALSFKGDPEALIEYARELGFDVSAQELREFHQQTVGFLSARIKNVSGTDLSPGAKEYYALLNLAETDADVAARLDEIGRKTREELIIYGKEKGFNFNEQDIREVTLHILEPSNEISEEDLELAAGGTTTVALVFFLMAAGYALVMGSLAAGVGAAAGAFVAAAVSNTF